MSQSVKAHAHHIISVQQRPAEKKYVNFSQQGEYIKKEMTKKKLFHTFWLLLWERELI